jgi:uncharacterized membrane protein YhfC
MEPYIIAGLIIFITFLIGAGLVKRIYDTRTRDLDIGNVVTDKLGLDLPDGVNINDALGNMFRR